MNKIIPLIVLLQLIVFASEPSVYGSGNLDSPNPYGLSKSEKKILENIKSIKALQKSSRVLELNYNNLKDKFSGLRSVGESFSDKIGKIDEKNSNTKNSIDELRDEVSSLRKDLNTTMHLQTENQEKVKTVLSELSTLIDSINSSYISKDEFDKYKSSVDARLELFEKNTKSNDFASRKRDDLEKEANTLLRKKSYTKATKIFTFLVDKKYHPAGNSYKLGEIAYAQKSYKIAIVHYKKSIALYDKASYVPTLLYHTGISLSKLNKNTEAKKFFKALKTNYPNSKEAKSLKN